MVGESEHIEVEVTGLALQEGGVVNSHLVDLVSHSTFAFKAENLSTAVRGNRLNEGQFILTDAQLVLVDWLVERVEGGASIDDVDVFVEEAALESMGVGDAQHAILQQDVIPS